MPPPTAERWLRIDMRTTLILLLLCCALRAQATLNVPQSFATIQAAMNAASNGDIVLIAPGTYTENLVWPATELSLIGAGVGLTIVDGGQAGTCLEMTNGVSSSVIEGITFRNGSGKVTSTIPVTLTEGGALYIDHSFGAGPSFIMHPIFRNCRFESSNAQVGGGFVLRLAGLTMEDCVIAGNALGSVQPCCVVQAPNVRSLNLTRCTFEQNENGLLIAGPSSSTSTGPQVVIEDSVFRNNTVATCATIFGSTVRVTGCQFVDNDLSAGAFDTGILHATQTTSGNLRLESTLFTDNKVNGALITTSSVGASHLINLSIVNNQKTAFPALTQAFVIGSSGVGLIIDALIQGNRDVNLNLMSAPIQVNVASPGPLTVFNANVQGQAGNFTNVIDVDPMFVDPINGDYRFLPGSPMIDAGTAPSTGFMQSTIDASGRPRVQGTSIDIGAIEAQSLAHHPAASGQVGASQGTVEEILTINGSTGGLMRAATVAVGASVSVEMAQPTALALPTDFSIFGILGEADFSSVVNVPLGIGDMMFAPGPLLPFPFAFPGFFTLASSIGALGPYAPLFPATPTPWISGPGPSIPFPITMTLQGVIQEAPNVFVPTNAIILKVE